MKNLRASDWLKPSAFVMYHGCKAGTLIQITNSACAFKISFTLHLRDTFFMYIITK